MRLLLRRVFSEPLAKEQKNILLKILFLKWRLLIREKRSCHREEIKRNIEDSEEGGGSKA